MIRDSDASTVASVAGVVMQVVADVSVQWPVSAGNAVLPMECPLATYKVLYSFSSSGQLAAL